MKSERIFNFSAGPAVLPLPVLEQAQRELVSLPDVGMSILEVSHRSKVFEGVLARAEADIRELAGVPSNYRVLFLQGGASLQFTMVPMNLLQAGMTADYLVTGAWSSKAVDEARKVGNVHVAATTKAEQFTRIPRAEEIVLTPGAAYVHMTSNNTIYGTEWKALPDVGDIPLVSDTSSDMFSRPIDVGRHALIYAGAQKNMGPAGVTVVIVRERSAGAISGVASRDAELRGPRRKRVDVQHASRVRDLHARAGHALADWPGRSRAQWRR